MSIMHFWHISSSTAAKTKTNRYLQCCLRCINLLFLFGVFLASHKSVTWHLKKKRTVSSDWSSELWRANRTAPSPPDIVPSCFPRMYKPPVNTAAVSQEMFFYRSPVVDPRHRHWSQIRCFLFCFFLIWKKSSVCSSSTSVNLRFVRLRILFCHFLFFLKTGQDVIVSGVFLFSVCTMMYAKGILTHSMQNKWI